ncbi:MAG: glycosyltransferase family 2 protein [Candidatus Omnitrophica bacterium]|nr:glycosyltransferase family 2 protein [Candidatus Omnitrophota bacterium]
MPYLSVIVPVYNESATVRQILDKINQLPMDKEIIAVDDGSTDNTHKVLNEIKYPELQVIHHANNRGKGQAVLTGLSHAQGEFVIIQDADLEYDPADYFKLIQQIKQTNADIVLGARFTQGHSGLHVHRLGNRFLTGLLNFLFGSNLNDYATCYKIARKEVFSSLSLKATGFDFDVEMICKALKKKLKISEVAVQYFPRTYKEGKKIRWHDGLWAIFYLIKYRITG